MSTNRRSDKNRINLKKRHFLVAFFCFPIPIIRSRRRVETRRTAKFLFQLLQNGANMCVFNGLALKQSGANLFHFVSNACNMFHNVAGLFHYLFQYKVLIYKALRYFETSFATKWQFLRNIYWY